MIISASYKTDIPTFYGEWFMNRLRAGFCKMVNPYNRKVLRVSLKREDVEGIVFWTKNVGPFMKHLPEVRERGFPFMVQHTINGYPKALEQAVIDWRKSVENVKRVAEEYGPRVPVWRYDTIIDSSLTPREFHIESFTRIAKALEGSTDEVVISFAQLYKKTLRNMDHAAAEEGFTWQDPPVEWKSSLAKELSAIATNYDMRLNICSQPQLISPSAGEARCVDARRLSDIAGRSFKVELKGSRKECGCFKSRDIGEYDTCPHGCVYCYAVQNQALAKRRYKEHDPMGEALFPLPLGAEEEQPTDPQLDLF